MEIVAKEMTLDTKLDLSRTYWIKTNATGNYF